MVGECVFKVLYGLYKRIGGCHGRGHPDLEKERTNCALGFGEPGPDAVGGAVTACVVEDLTACPDSGLSPCDCAQECPQTCGINGEVRKAGGIEESKRFAAAFPTAFSARVAQDMVSSGLLGGEFGASQAVENQSPDSHAYGTGNQFQNTMHP